MFFSEPEIIDKFVELERKGEKAMNKAYKKQQLVDICNDLEISNAGTKSVLIQRIRKAVGPATERNLRQKILDSDIQKLQAKEAGVKHYKPYEEMSLQELQAEADDEQIISSGSRNDIIKRLIRLDDEDSPYRDSTTEFLRDELKRDDYLYDGDRDTLLARLNRIDSNTSHYEDRPTKWLKNLLKQERRITTGSREELIARANKMNKYGNAADFETAYLKELLAEHNLSQKGGRKDWLIRMYQVEVEELYNALDHLKRQLKQKPRVVYRTKYRSSGNRHKKSSVLGSMARGAAFGAGIGIASRVFRGRQHEQKPLKF